MSHTIMITGASGHLGRGVLEHLLNIVPTDRLIALARDPKKVEQFAAKGVAIRQADFNEPASLEKAFAGIHTLLFIPTVETGKRTTQNRNVVNAAQRAGVSHILYVGVIHHDEPGHGEIVSDHQDAEEVIRKSGIAHTFIRNGLYLDVLPTVLGEPQESGVIAYPTATRGLSVALRSDLAEATAQILADTSLQGGVIELAIGQPIYFPQVAEMLSRLTGKEVRHVDVSYDDLHAALLQHGLPELIADVYTGMARAIAEGVINTSHSHLEKILRRKPVDLESFFRTVIQTPVVI